MCNKHWCFISQQSVGFRKKNKFKNNIFPEALWQEAKSLQEILKERLLKTKEKFSLTKWSPVVLDRLLSLACWLGNTHACSVLGLMGYCVSCQQLSLLEIPHWKHSLDKRWTSNFKHRKELWYISTHCLGNTTTSTGSE